MVLLILMILHVTVTILSSFFISIYPSSRSWNNVVDGINATYKHYLKDKMEIIGKLGSNDTTKIGMLPSASKYVSVKFSYQCLHILNNKLTFNGIKGSTKIQNR